MPFAPLAGIRVLDLTRLLPGPFLSQIFVDLGADVVKVEEPGTGDYTRWIAPEVDGVGYAYAAVNRGKRSIAIDLKKPGAAALVLRLAARADVFLESFRPGVLDRLGLSDEALARANPRLVRLSLSGYGPGPWRDDVGHDLNYVALSGALAQQPRGADGVPGPLSVQVADLGGALYGATAVMAALLERERTGRGQRVEVALADAALGLNALPLQRARAGEDPLAKDAWELTGGMPCYRVYACADERFVALGALEQKFWERFAAAIGDADLEELQLDRSDEAHARVARVFRTRGADEWVAFLRKAGVPITPVLSPTEVPERAGPGWPLTRRAAEGKLAALGEHGDEVLREAGLSEAEVAHLRASNVLG